MGLYWKDIEIIPGMLLAVEFLHPEAYSADGSPADVRWKVLSFGSRGSDDAYIDYSSGRKYPLQKVLKNRRLQTKLEKGLLLQLPSGIEFMIVQEYHNGDEAYRRCYNLDMLHAVRSLRVLG